MVLLQMMRRLLDSCVSSHPRVNRDGEFDYDLEDIMVMEAKQYGSRFRNLVFREIHLLMKIQKIMMWNHQCRLFHHPHLHPVGSLVQSLFLLIASRWLANLPPIKTLTFHHTVTTWFREIATAVITMPLNKIIIISLKEQESAILDDLI